MTEREKLINLLSTAGWNLFTDTQSKEQIADYLLANGVIILPVKIGDTVYRVNSVMFPDKQNGCFKEYTKVVESVLKRSDIALKGIYLTREEAEKTLAEME